MISPEFFESLPFEDHRIKLDALREENPEEYLYVLASHHRNIYFNSPEPGNERKITYGGAANRFRKGLVEKGFSQPDVQDAINRVVLST